MDTLCMKSADTLGTIIYITQIIEKIMTVLELQEQRLALQEELTTLLSNGEAEARELNETEASRMAEIRSQIDSIDTQIEDINKQNETLAKQERNIKKENIQNKMANTKLVDLIKGIVNNNLTDEQRSMVNGNTIELRDDLQATKEDVGQENVPTEKKALSLAIRNASVLNKMGATWFTNCVGNIDLPKYNGSSTYWADSENAEAVDGAGQFEKVTLSPKRLTSYIVVSRQLLQQSPENLEAILIADLAKAVAEELDKTVFGADAGTDAQPAGIFYNATALAPSGITFEDVLALEEEVEENNGTDFIFVTNPKYKYALRGTQMAHGLQMVFEHGEIDGQKTIVSNSVSGIAVLNPKDLAVASWGGVNITVDPYTLAGKNQVRIVVNALYDAKLKGDRIAVRGEE